MSEVDWKVVKDALDMWRASQVAIRGHVQVVSEAVDRLYETRQRDSELILRLAKERNDARAERDEARARFSLEEMERLEARVQELKEALAVTLVMLPQLADQQAMPDDWWQANAERARAALGT